MKPSLIAILATLAALAVAAVYLIVWVERNGPGEQGASPLSIYATIAPENFNPTNGTEEMPDISFQDSTGKVHTSSEFRGKLILLNLWATWCAPCRREMPSLDALQQNMGSGKFKVVAVSVDRDGLALARDFLKEIGAGHLAVYNDPSSRVNVSLHAFGLPTSLLISSKGRVLGRFIGPVAWNGKKATALIEAVLAKGL